MNSSEHIKGILLSSFEPEEIEEWADPYNSIHLKLLTTIIYLLEIWASVVMLTFVSYETKGLFGHYRTVINQLLSYVYAAVSMETFSIMMNVWAAAKLRYFSGSFIWNNCVWNHKFQDMVWTTATRNMPISRLGLKCCDLVFSFNSVLHFSGQIYVYLCVEMYAGYE